MAPTTDPKKAWDILALNFTRTTLAVLLPQMWTFHDVDLLVGLIGRIQHAALGAAMVYFHRWVSDLKFHANEDCGGLEKGPMLDLLSLKLCQMSSKPFDMDASADAASPSAREYFLFGTQWDSQDEQYRTAINRTNSKRIQTAGIRTPPTGASAQAGPKRPKQHNGPSKGGGMSTLDNNALAYAKAGAPPQGATAPCLFGKHCKNKPKCTKAHTAAEVGDPVYAAALKANGLTLG